MAISDAVRRCLIDVDVVGIRSLWKTLLPHAPQPQNNKEALIALHIARTASVSVPVSLRLYSHKWLSERGLPSRLPDHMKPMADRLYPVAVTAVGVSANSKHLAVKEGVQVAMENAVLECFGDGVEDADVVKQRMLTARAIELRGLSHGRRFWR